MKTSQGGFWPADLQQLLQLRLRSHCLITQEGSPLWSSIDTVACKQDHCRAYALTLWPRHVSAGELCKGAGLTVIAFCQACNLTKESRLIDNICNICESICTYRLCNAQKTFWPNASDIHGMMGIPPCLEEQRVSIQRPSFCHRCSCTHPSAHMCKPTSLYKTGHSMS